LVNSINPTSGNVIDFTKNIAGTVMMKVINTSATGASRFQLEGDGSSLLSLRNYNASSGGYTGDNALISTNKDLITSIAGTSLDYKIVTDNSSLTATTTRMTMNSAGEFAFGSSSPLSGVKAYIEGDTRIDGDLDLNGNADITGNVIMAGINNIVAIGTNGETQDSTIAFRVKSNRGTLFSFEDYISAVSSTVRLSLSGGGQLLGTNLDHTSRVYLGTPTLWGGSSAQLAVKGASGSYSLFLEGSTAHIGLAVSNGASNVGIGNLATGPYKFYVVNSNAQGVVARFDGSSQIRQLEIVDNGGIGINGTPVADTALDIQSTTAALRLPRLSTTTRDGLASPVAGMFIYNSTTNKLNFYNGSAWEAVTSA
jgi:hypothetical protein